MNKVLLLQRLFSLLLFSGALLTLAACGGGGGSDSGPSSNNPGGNVSSSSSSTNGNSSSAGNSSSSAAIKPNMPTSLLASRIGSTKVTLTWEAPGTGATITAYRLTRNGQVVGNVDGNTTQFTDTNLNPENQYTYRVQAGDSAGNWSSLSMGYSVRTAPPGNDWVDPPTSSSSSSSSRASSSSRSSSSAGGADRTAPTTPSGLRATSIKDTSIDLTWNQSTDNVGVTLYRITRNGETIATVSGFSRDYLDLDLLPNTEYNYRVTAGDAAGNWSVATGALSVRTTSTITGSKLQWSHPTQRENGQYLELNEIGGYEIRYRLNSLGNYTSVTVNGNSTREYALGNIPSNSDFQIAVYDTQGLYSEFVGITPQ